MGPGSLLSIKCVSQASTHVTHWKGQIVLFGNWDMPVMSEVLSFAYTTPSVGAVEQCPALHPLPSHSRQTSTLPPQIDQSFYRPLKIIPLIQVQLQSARIAAHLPDNLQLGWGNLYTMWTILDPTLHLGMSGSCLCLSSDLKMLGG